jgi:hypothetical protein
MQYRTRHLEALTDFPHGQRSLSTGEKFEASEIDAEYYERHKKAKILPDDSEAAAPAPSPTQPPPRPAPAAPEPAPMSRRAAPRSAPASVAPPGVMTLAEVNPDAAAAAASAGKPADAIDAPKARAGDA